MNVPFCSLQQVADAGISIILLVAFSLVIAGASIYIVNERLNGEKLQQKLCGVSFKTYWGVAFAWDFTVSFTYFKFCLERLNHLEKGLINNINVFFQYKLMFD